ncbi:MAG: TerD family protein [Bacteroidia bacterium]|nr:TerD family protein [Bacteroidia bacterium]
MPRFCVGLGWDPNESASAEPFDIDASVFMLDERGKIPGESYFVFYNNLRSPDGSVVHMGDSREGVGSGDDEIIIVDTTKISPAVRELVFVVTIHQASEKRQSFGQIRNSYIRIYNNASGEEIAKYELNEDFSRETKVEFGRLVRHGAGWRFEATGVGETGSLQDYVNRWYDGN